MCDSTLSSRGVCVWCVVCGVASVWVVVVAARLVYGVYPRSHWGHSGSYQGSSCPPYIIIIMVIIIFVIIIIIIIIIVVVVVIILISTQHKFKS